MRDVTIGYCAFAHIAGTVSPPRIKAGWGVSLVVLNPEEMAWRGEGLLQLAMREDVEFQELRSMSVAEARNRLVTIAQSKYLVIGDQGTTFDAGGLSTAAQYLDEHPDVAAVCASQGVVKGAKSGSRLNHQNSTVAPIESLMLRVSKIRQAGLWFSGDLDQVSTSFFGTGYQAICQLLDAGADVRYLDCSLSSQPKQVQNGRLLAEESEANLLLARVVLGPRSGQKRWGLGFKAFRNGSPLTECIRFVRSR